MSSNLTTVAVFYSHGPRERNHSQKTCLSDIAELFGTNNSVMQKPWVSVYPYLGAMVSICNYHLPCVRQHLPQKKNHFLS